MASKLLGVCLLFFFVLMAEAIPDGICNRTEPTGATKLERRWRVVHGIKKTYMIYVPVTKNILECCKGYLQAEIVLTTNKNLSGTETPLKCNPQCEHPCENGDCVEPNVCKCSPGYEFTNGTCAPVCSKSCHNGTCVKPETCKCLPGYRMTDAKECTPFCSLGCDNGSCISPETCHCNDGYSLTNGTCEPKCWPPCETGECIAPDTCSCAPGFERIGTNSTSCEPICSPACENGACVGPNICMCNREYAWENGTCVPVCSPPCVNGVCTHSFDCLCEPGYDLQSNICVPASKWLVTDSPKATTKTVNPINETILPATVVTVPSVETEHKSPLTWLYYVIPILVVIILVLILIWKRRFIAECCKRRSYVVSEDKKHTGNKNNIPDVTYSADRERQERREERNA